MTPTYLSRSATEELKVEQKQEALQSNADDFTDPQSKLRQTLNVVMSDDDPDVVHRGWYHNLASICKKITTHPLFTNGVILAIVFVAVATGLEADNSTNISMETFALINFIALLAFSVEVVLKVRHTPRC